MSDDRGVVLAMCSTDCTEYAKLAAERDRLLAALKSLVAGNPVTQEHLDLIREAEAL